MEASCLPVCVPLALARVVTVLAELARDAKPPQVFVPDELPVAVLQLGDGLLAALVARGAAAGLAELPALAEFAALASIPALAEFAALASIPALAAVAAPASIPALAEFAVPLAAPPLAEPPARRGGPREPADFLDAGWIARLQSGFPVLLDEPQEPAGPPRAVAELPRYSPADLPVCFPGELPLSLDGTPQAQVVPRLVRQPPEGVPRGLYMK